jgi:AraC family transcriptional activator of mtrCDE
VRAPGAAGDGGPPITTHYRNALRVQASIGVEPDTELICDRLHFEAIPQNLIVTALPDVVVLHVGERPLASRFYSTCSAFGTNWTAPAPALALSRRTWRARYS